MNSTSFLSAHCLVLLLCIIIFPSSITGGEAEKKEKTTKVSMIKKKSSSNARKTHFGSSILLSCPRVEDDNSKVSRSPLYRFRFSCDNFSLLTFIHGFNFDFKGMFFQWNFVIAFLAKFSFLIISTTSFLSTTSVSYWKWQKVGLCCSDLLSHST